jgi:hypothetical protein
MFSNGGWAYDAYPELKTLDAHTAITVADIKGPGVITCIHITQHKLFRSISRPEEEVPLQAILARGIILEVYYNDSKQPSVKVPLADFFADGCCGQAGTFGTMFVEKTPGSYNCFIPMPFEKSARVVLINETEYNLSNYTFVEYEQFPEWDEKLGYFHAAWKRSSFQLNDTTNLLFFHIDGSGHFFGRSWSICTDEPFFDGFFWVMEANNEVYIDGEQKQRLDYLGTEDSFAFSYGFKEFYCGPYAGMNFIKKDLLANLNLLSIFRFMKDNAIRFNKSFDLRINWSQEHSFVKREGFLERIAERNKCGGAWIDYATTNYWYQKEIGYSHEEMPPINERCKIILVSNKNVAV